MPAGACCDEPAVPPDTSWSQVAPASPASQTGDPAPATTLGQLDFATTDESGFARKRPARAGDWLAVHEERGQSFDEYANSSPVRANGKRRVLAFVPVGEFELPQREIVAAAAEFSGIWFDLETRSLPGLPLPVEGWQRERSLPWSGNPVRQYHTRYFLERLLPRSRPDDAVCVIGVTMSDLYPDEAWNYVFGEASLRRRVGVYSLARYFASFWGTQDSEDTRALALQRALKLVTHEIGHTLGMEHCVEYGCNMNGSNSLEESDRPPLRLCPVCLEKLQWNRGFDVLGRYRKLASFYRRHGMAAEADWTARRIEQIAAQP